MFFYEGQTCPVCGKHFAESDDIVACPACGCPHHRECWKQEGQCHFAADHGTDRQWAQGQSTVKETSAENPTRRCPNCGTENPEFAEFCSRCGRDLECEEWESAQPTPDTQYTPPAGNTTPPYQAPYSPWPNQPFQPPLQDPYGGLDRHERIDDFTVDELAEVIGTNSAYYLPRFLKMSRGGSKISWNNAAFFFSHNWLLYRKNIVWGIVFFAVTFALQLVVQILFPDAAINGVLALSQQERVLYGILSLAELSLSVLTGLFGNYLYMLSVFRKARKNRENPKPSYERTFLEAGGTSFALFAAPLLINVLIVWFMMFFGL